MLGARTMGVDWETSPCYHIRVDTDHLCHRDSILKSQTLTMCPTTVTSSISMLTTSIYGVRCPASAPCPSFPSTRDVLILGRFVFVCILLAIARTRKLRSNATLLQGPPSQTILWGVRRSLQDAADRGELYEQWETLYGGVYEIPGAAGSGDVVLSDPTALSHLLAKDATLYAKPTHFKRGTENLVGRGLVWAEGPDHQRYGNPANQSSLLEPCASC